MVKLDGSCHPALLGRPGTGIIFDGIKKRWVLEDGSDCALPYDEIYRATFEARDRLLATCNNYRKKLKQPLLEVNTNHNWREVEESVQVACSGLEKLATKDKDMSGSLGKLKRAFRGLCRNAGAGQTAATLIPNDSFGFSSVLCGSLKVVFNGLRTTGLYRLEVYRTLEDLPQQLKDLAADVNVNDRDEEIHRRAAALYVAAFNLLNHILLWFLKNTWLTGVKLLADPTGFMDKLRDCQAELKTASQAFEARLNKLSRDTERETMQLSYWNTYSQASIHSQLQTITRQITEERESRLEVLEGLKPLLNTVMGALQERALTGSNREHQKRIPDIDPEHVLEHFLYEPDLIRKDCMTLNKRSSKWRRTSHDASRLIALQTNPRLLAWLTVDEPALLLLNGRAEPRPDSAVSLFTAQMLYQLLEHHQTHSGHEISSLAIITIGFFCGQHPDWQEDSNGNPEELAMSLLLQLIDRARGHIDPAVLRQCYENTKPGNINSICSMFETLVMSLDSEVVLIIVIDGLRFFAQPPKRCGGTTEVISRLTRLYRQESDATLKLLFSSPTRSEFVEDLFNDEELLSLPRDFASGRKSHVRSRMVVDEPQSEDDD
ncbi:hypothetical protein CC80DRAFT_398038 [Byssothecium circinans]|uniref:Fungal STAND N-terminal Goodbye domain-containing protein n=1 Tax=Byssothecium circinans TaxID=147558 RepID=A0A6A5UR95_9PLEO|nr:hypothetical protein CC80DRAFT_398038 [Byssothecium circinans]